MSAAQRREPVGVSEQTESWSVVAALRQVWHRFRQDSGRLPAGTWRSFGASVGLGIVLVAALTLGMTLLAQGWHDQWLREWDARMLQQIIERAPLSFSDSINWETPGNLIFMPISVISITLLAAWWRRPLIAASMATLYMGLFIFIWIGWLLWSRDRPDVVAEGMAAPGFHSFPSGHAALTASVFGFLAYLWFRSTHNLLERLAAIVGLVVLIGLVGCARLVLGTHWPSDIMAGTIIGAAWLTVIAVALHRAERKAAKP